MTKHNGYTIELVHESNGGGYQCFYKAPGGNGTFTGDVDNPCWLSLGKAHKTEEDAKAFLDELKASK